MPGLKSGLLRNGGSLDGPQSFIPRLAIIYVRHRNLSRNSLNRPLLSSADLLQLFPRSCNQGEHLCCALILRHVSQLLRQRQFVPLDKHPDLAA
jgi:hypothetical protein